MTTTRTCIQCQEPIPSHRNRKAIYCSPLCKRRAQYDKEKASPPARQKPPCPVEGCGSAQFAKGLCQKHYARMRSKGTLDDTRKNAKGVCSVEGCDRPHLTGGLCSLHHDRKRRAEAREARLAARAFRRCLECGEPIRPEQRDDTLFCSAKCKGAQRIRDGRAADSSKRHYYSSQYGMSREDIVAKFGEQCGICGGDGTVGRHGTLHIDHDHATGLVRGMLCHECNTGLGKFKDDPALLLKAVEYLSLARAG